MSMPSNVLPCRPVVWNPLLLPGEETPIYDGSIEYICQIEECQTPVYVGPRQQQVMEIEGDNAMVICFMCAAFIRSVHPTKGKDIVSLGNPQGDR